MFILEVLIANGNRWPHNTDRVRYGPFHSRQGARNFFNSHKRGEFTTTNPQDPVFDPDHMVITDILANLNNPDEGVRWDYMC
jgi:hypothetical protein